MDTGFPDNAELSLDDDGTPHLKLFAVAEQPTGLSSFSPVVSHGVV